MFTFENSTRIADKQLYLIEQAFEDAIIVCSNNLGNDFYKFYDYLSSNKHDESNKKTYPIDTVAFHGKLNEYNSIYIGNYNCTGYNFVIVLTGSAKENSNDFVCFQYYTLIDNIDFTTKQNNILCTCDVLQTYSDNVSGNTLVSRPDIKFLESNIDKIIKENEYHLFTPILMHPVSRTVIPTRTKIADFRMLTSILKYIDLSEISN